MCSSSALLTPGVRYSLPLLGGVGPASILRELGACDQAILRSKLVSYTDVRVYSSKYYTYFLSRS